jgi:hypothetical protein
MKRNVENVWGARYTLGARYESKKYGNWPVGNKGSKNFPYST